MNKFMQALAIVILVSLAAQVVLDAVAPLVPYAIVIGLAILVGSRWLGKKRNNW